MIVKMANRMFMQMRRAALQRLKKRDPETLARNAGVVYDAEKRTFSLDTLGASVELSYPDYLFTPELPQWHQLVILHYIDLADGCALEDRLITFSKLKDGRVRGSGFDRISEASIPRLIARISEDEFCRRCFTLGGQVVPSNSDFMVSLPFLPRFPVLLNIWFADEEFPASARMLLYAGADHYLTVEDAVTVGELILERLGAETAL